MLEDTKHTGSAWVRQGRGCNRAILAVDNHRAFEVTTIKQSVFCSFVRVSSVESCKELQGILWRSGTCPGTGCGIVALALWYKITA